MAELTFFNNIYIFLRFTVKYYANFSKSLIICGRTCLAKDIEKCCIDRFVPAFLNKSRQRGGR